MDESKTCTACGEIKARSEFHKRSASPDGLFYRCKKCRSEASAARYAATVNDEKRATNRDRRRRQVAAMSDLERDERRRRNREYMRTYKHPAPELRASYLEDWRRENAAAIRAYRKWYRAQNLESLAERDRKRRLANPAQVKAEKRAWYERNAEKVRARVKRWQQENPDRFHELALRRRARLLAARVGKVDLAELWTGRCGICNDPLSPELKHPHPMSKSVDHIVPLARGGAHSQDNLQYAHLVCNLRKGTSLSVT